MLGRPLRRLGAVENPAYVKDKRELLERYGLDVYAISNHLKGQAVCDDPIDARHRAILPDRIWGDGDAEGVRQRAAEERTTTARAARLGVNTVVGLTGSSIWKYVAMFPPVGDDGSGPATTTSPPAGTRSGTTARYRRMGGRRHGPSGRRTGGTRVGTREPVRRTGRGVRRRVLGVR